MNLFHFKNTRFSTLEKRVFFLLFIQIKIYKTKLEKPQNLLLKLLIYKLLLFFKHAISAYFYSVLKDRYSISNRNQKEPILKFIYLFILTVNKFKAQIILSNIKIPGCLQTIRKALYFQNLKSLINKYKYGSNYKKSH